MVVLKSKRVVFLEFENGENIGVRKMIRNVIQGETECLTARSYVDRCLNELGALEASATTHETLVQFFNANGLPSINLSTDRNLAESKLALMFGVFGSMPEFQRA